MQEKEEKIVSDTDEVSVDTEENEDEQRPPVDPKNGLYTAISLIIFAVCYLGWMLISDSIDQSYSLYSESFNERETEIITDLMGYEAIPEGVTLQSARLNKGFDGNMLYINLSCGEVTESEDDDTDVIAALLPFQSGDPERDVRYGIYVPDEEEIRMDYVYADSYVDISDPTNMCIVYEDGDETVIQLRISSYDSSAAEKAFGSGVKIEYDE